MEQVLLYLGYAGENNMRLGESLYTVKWALNFTKKIQQGLPIKLFEPDAYIQAMSACVNNLYTIKDANELFNLLKNCNSDVNVGYINPKNIKLNRDSIIPLLGNSKVEDYLVSFQMLKILNEKVWPQIVRCVLTHFQRESHTYVLYMPLHEVNINDSFKKSTIFTEETKRWLKFHFLGSVEKMELKKDAIILVINLLL